MALTVKIGVAGSEVDLTAYLIYNSLRIEQRADSFVSTCSLQLIDENADLTLKVKDSILIADGATKYFSGVVSNLDTDNFAEGTTSLIHTLECQDYNILVEEVTIDQLETYGAAQDSAIIDDLFDTYLPEINSHTPGGAPAGYVQSLHVFAEIDFENISLRAALDRIASEVESTALAGYWYIDFDKYLHYFNVEDNTPAWSLSDTPDDVTSFDYFSPVRRSQQGAAIVNRILVVGAEVALFVQDYDSYDYFGKWFEGIVRDNTLLTVDEVIDHGNSLLKRWAYPNEVFEVKTYKEGLRAGMNVEFDCTLFGTKTRTNHIINPSFENNVANGWTFAQGGAGGSAAQSAVRASVGAQSCKLLASNAGNAEQRSDNIAVADDSIVTIQVRIYRPTDISTDIEIYDVTNGASRATLVAASTAIWEFLTVSWENGTGGAVNVSLRVRNKEGDGSSEIWFDAAMTEIDKGGVPLEYIDGTLTYCSWTGAAHNSTSTRPAVFMIKQLEITWPENTITYGLTLGGTVSPTALIKARTSDDNVLRGLGPIISGQLPLASKGWSHDVVFSATDFNTVAWAGGSTLDTAANDVFSIAAGNTGNMAADTIYYLYLDVDTSLTVLQVSAGTPAIGKNIILVAVAVAVPDVATDKARFQVFGGEGIGVFITADNIAANTITANEIAANTITAAEITANTITATEIAAATITATEIAANTITADRLSMGMGDSVFSRADGLLLLGPTCPITSTSWTSLRKQEATISGAFHQEQSRWPGTRGLVVEEATTNLATNPSFETNTTDWRTVTGGALAQSSDYARYGSYSLKFTQLNANEVIDHNGATFELADDDYVTVSAWVRGTPGETIRLVVRDATTGVNHEGSNYTLSSDWQRLQATWRNETGGAVDVYMRVRLPNSAGEVTYVDAAQMEQKAYATTYCDGSLGIGYAWTGVAHASTSTRAVTNVVLDAHTGLISGNNTLSFALRVQVPYDHDAVWPASPNFFEVSDGTGNNRIVAFFNIGAGTFVVRVNVGGAGDISATSSVHTFDAGDWIYLLFTVDFAGSVYIYIDGIQDGDADISGFAAPNLTTWRVGTNDTAAEHSGLIFDVYAAFDRVLTINEAAAIYALDKPLVDHGAIDTPGIYILDGKFSIASSTTGIRSELLAESFAIGNPPPTYDSGVGIFLGIDGGIAKVFVGDDGGEKILWDGSDLTVIGDITIQNPGAIDGSTITNDSGWTDDTAADAAQASADAANKHRILGVEGTWTVTDADTISWGADVALFLGDGTEVNILAGNTGNMVAKTYIYYDTTTTLKTTTDPDVIGGTHVLVAVAENGNDKANVQIVGGGTYISGDWINTGSVTASEIKALTITASEIAANAITTTKINAEAVTASRLSLGIGEMLFRSDNGLLLLGPHLKMTAAGGGSTWTTLRSQTADIDGAISVPQGRWVGTRGLKIGEGTINECTGPMMYDDEVPPNNLAENWLITETLNDPYVASIIAHDLGERGWFQRFEYTGVGADVAESLQFYTRGGAATFAPGETATGSLDIRGAASGCTVYIQLDALNNVNISQGNVTQAVTLLTELQRVSVNYPVLPANTDKMRISLYITGVDNGDEFDVYFGAAQVEKKDHATLYCNGDLGVGWAWDGAQYESSSERDDTIVRLTDYVDLVSSKDTLSFALWAQMPYDFDGDWPQANDNTLFHISGAGGNIINLDYDPTVPAFEAYIIGGDRLVSSAPSFSAGDWLHFVLTIDFANNIYKLYINGELEDTDTTVLAAQILTAWRIGGVGATNQGDFTIGEYAVFNEVVTVEDVTQIFNLQRPLVDAGAVDKPGIYILDGRFRITGSTSGNRIEITAEEIAGYDGAGTKQFYLQSEDGKAYAGGGTVILDETGVTTERVYFEDDTHYLYLSGDDIWWKPGAGAAVKLN